MSEHGKAVAHAEQLAETSDKTQGLALPPGRTGANIGGKRAGFEPQTLLHGEAGFFQAKRHSVRSESPKMPGDIVNWTPGLTCEAPLGFHEALNEALHVGGGKEENTPGPQDAPGFTKIGDRIRDVFNDVMERNGRKAGGGKTGSFEAAMRDFKSQKAGNVKVRVAVGFDADDGKAAGMGVFEEESTETADIEYSAARATLEHQMVEKPFVLPFFPRRRSARAKEVRIRAITNEGVAIIEGHQFLLGRPLAGEEHTATGTFVNA